MSNTFSNKRKLSQTNWMDNEIDEIDEQLEDQHFDVSLYGQNQQNVTSQSPFKSLESPQRKAITEDVNISIPLNRPTLVPLPKLIPK